MWFFNTLVVIAQRDFKEIVKRIFQNKLVEGRVPFLPIIYSYFKEGAIKYRLGIDEQVLIISASIQESEGYQKMVATQETDYKKRFKYRGRGYIRLTGEANYRNAYKDLKHLKHGNFYYLPFFIDSEETSWLVSFWIWEKIIKPKITSIQKGSITDNMIFLTKTLYSNLTDDRLKLCLKMIFLTKALHPDATDDYLKLSLEIHKIAQDCVEEAQDQLRQEKESQRGESKLKSD
eukprot:GHVP01070508.1.p1 GENE.GHVP01070508.1~~GHVP01070508.1.p1  ORF type:complete len:233 (-),score=31.57 GHVP01070508.1:58-756(-)